MKSMIIKQCEHGGIMNFCACHPLPKPEEAIEDPEAIPSFYSEKHAKDEGWVKTDHIKYCPPDKQYVWVCPECAAKENWRIKDVS